MRFGKFQLNAVNLLNVMGILIVLYLVVTLGQTIKRNYELNRQISQLSGQLSLIKAQKDQLAYQLKYYGTTSFQERQAHSQLGLVNPGETVVVLPSTSPAPTPATSTGSSTAGKQSNWSQWLSFLGGSSAK